ncbi:hypothetical protein K0U83_19380 [bacterium]|nr:hypothetical protein [bacterium]
MANVGNLFVNISGSTKGLTKALGTAKTKLAAFDKQVGRPGGDFMRRARGRFTSAMNERRQFSQQMSSFIGPQPAGHVEKIQARLGKKEKGARQGYRQAQREQAIGGMTARTRMITAGVLGILGLTVGGVSMMARKAMSQIQSAKVGVEKFRYIGPQGKRIIKAEMDMLMNSISSAQRPEVSQALAEKAEAKLAAQVESNAGGGTVMAVTLEEYMERIGQVFTNSISGLFNNPAAGVTAIVTGNPTLNTALNVANNTQGASNP